MSKMTQAIDENSETEELNFISNYLLTGFKSFVEVNLANLMASRKSSSLVLTSCSPSLSLDVAESVNTSRLDLQSWFRCLLVKCQF